MKSKTANLVSPSDFGPFGGRIWFNCAHQGPLPKVAVSAAQKALRQKANPYLIKDDEFVDLPRALKASIGRLVGANAEDIILGNSASYGLHVLRNGISWKTGDEILLVSGDFPATIYPWLTLQEKGVKVRLLKLRQLCLQADELRQEITPSTRLLCVSWVNSFNGSVLDISAIGKLCRKQGVMFVLNGSQAVGARKVDLRREPVDALVSCGYKWLCGPYATGFCWIKPELRDLLKPTQTYWLPQVWGEENLTDYSLKSDIGSAAFDVFCPANFLNFAPWRASIEYLLSIGIDIIEEYNSRLVDRLVNGIDKTKFNLESPMEHSAQSAIVSISHKYEGGRRNSEIHALLVKAGIDLALRNGKLRFSLHLYNTPEQVDRAISIINCLGLNTV